MTRILVGSDFRIGKPPKESDFNFGKMMFGSFLKNHHQVEFASFFGSFSRSEHTLLSDIDLFVVYSGQTSCFLKSLREFIQEDLKNLSIPVEMLVFKKDHLERGLHDLGGTILHEIKYSAESASFVGKFDFSTIKSPKDSLGGFFGSKHKGRFKDYPFISWDLQNNSREISEYLQRLSQTCNPMMRTCLSQNGLLPDKALRKKEVADLYQKNFGTEALTRYQGVLMLCEEIERSSLLQLSGSGDFDSLAYDQALRNFFDMTPTILEFLEDIEQESCSNL